MLCQIVVCHIQTNYDAVLRVTVLDSNNAATFTNCSFGRAHGTLTGILRGETHPQTILINPHGLDNPRKQHVGTSTSLPKSRTRHVPRSVRHRPIHSPTVSQPVNNLATARQEPMRRLQDIAESHGMHWLPCLTLLPHCAPESSLA